MKCWICHRQARHFGHLDLRYRIGQARRYPTDWVFCSGRCQACFHRLYVAGVHALERNVMIDPTAVEVAAMEQCLRPLGEAASEIGLDRSLASYSRHEALRLINAVVTAYVEAMVQEHERSKYPPVRMQLDARLDARPSG